MKTDMIGTIVSMKPWAPGSPSTNVEIHFNVNGPESPISPSARVVMVIAKEDAEHLRYGQKLRVVVTTEEVD